MHTLVIVDRSQYRDHMKKLVVDTAKKYKKACYMSFNDPYHIVIEMLDNVNIDKDKFIIIDASGNVKELQFISNTTYVLPVKDLFDVYLFLRNLIKEESIDMLLLDSVSALIYKYNELPLKEMLTNLLLEVGTFRCNSSIVVYKEDANHEVVSHLGPLIGNRFYL